MLEREGLDTIAALRRVAPGVRIIAMSGGGRGSATTYLQIASRTGAASVLSKPFSQQELTWAIDEASHSA